LGRRERIDLRPIEFRPSRRIVCVDRRVARCVPKASQSSAMARVARERPETEETRDASGTRPRFDALQALLPSSSGEHSLDGATKSSVLVIEDDDAIREALGILLGDDYEVTCVARLSDARVVLRSAMPPHLVVLDLTLEGEHGSELLAELAFVADAPPVLVLSASRDAADVARDYDVPFMRKPFDVPDLLAAVAGALAKGARPRRAVVAR
jgi:CheY-like chemotaxis protein